MAALCVLSPRHSLLSSLPSPSPYLFCSARHPPPPPPPPIRLPILPNPQPALPRLLPSRTTCCCRSRKSLAIKCTYAVGCHTKPIPSCCNPVSRESRLSIFPSPTAAAPIPHGLLNLFILSFCGFKNTLLPSHPAIHCTQHPLMAGRPALDPLERVGVERPDRQAAASSVRYLFTAEDGSLECQGEKLTAGSW